MSASLALCRAGSSGQAKGFTLLELLLALSLTALLFALLVAGFHGVLRDWLREESVLGRGVDQGLSLLQLERALEGAFPHLCRERSVAADQPLGSWVFFEGESDRLSWVSTRSSRPGQGLAAWRIASGSEGGLLLRRAVAGADDPSGRLEAADEAPPLFPRHRLRLSYLAPAPPGGERQWLPAWSGREQGRLPLAVRLLLVPKPGSGAQPCELLVPILANEPLDPIRRN